jgi:hypothetical protein
MRSSRLANAVEVWPSRSWTRLDHTSTLWSFNDLNRLSMSTPYQVLRDLARTRQHHLESLSGREAALVGQLEGELVLVGRGSRSHLQDLRYETILASTGRARPGRERGPTNA